MTKLSLKSCVLITICFDIFSLTIILRTLERKFNIYLLYSTRPKDHMKNYSVQIDAYEKITLKYRSSIIKSLNYSFLTVHRLTFQINIPCALDNLEDCLDNECINGKCIKYFNDLNNRTFCQCKTGWSGKLYNKNTTCMNGGECIPVDEYERSMN